MGQVWCPPAAVWHYGYGNNFYSGFVRVEVVGDTLVLGQTCSVIEKNVTAYSSMNGQSFSSSFGFEITYAANDVIWLYVPETNAFDTLFNLNAVPGDHWLFADREAYYCEPESKFLVTDTGTMIMQGTPLRWLAVDIVNVSPFGTMIFPDTIIERIGPIGTFLLPHDFCNEQIDGNQGGDFRCYSDLEISYNNVFVTSCEIFLGVPEPLESPTIQLFPNPGFARLTLRTNGVDQGSSVKITDALSRNIASFTCGSTEKTLDTSTWASGLYLVEVVSDQGLRSVSKWVKQ